jgi:hypothetical protein
MRAAALLVPLLLFPLLFAETPPTAKDSPKGTLLLFDGKSALGWNVDGEAKVDKGILILGGAKQTKAEPTSHFRGGELSFESLSDNPKDVSLEVFGERVAVGDSKEGWRTQTSKVSGSDLRTAPPLVITVPAGSKVQLRNVRFTPKLDEVLFNGKDLTGWKELSIKEKKSKYAITKEGWLNIKDGPGDLQTTGTYDDFVLQLECISNGKHLNSGVFFRSIPDKTWAGYEAQIRNEFTEKPAQKYTVEDYDPKTHKLLGKRTIASNAVDFGTGAIYRRVPARKQLSKDGEWFTMTILAHGRHIASWVNGVQVVDWFDHRPENDSGRNGYRSAAGAISLQGHDPTTDLSFRNLRLGKLK